MRAGYFTIDDNEARSIEISPPRRLAASGIAIGALALGFAVPARADDVIPPLPPDTAAPAALATAVQTAASNVNVSIRIGSPGDASAVTQTIATAVEAAAQSVAPPATPSAAPTAAAAGATQTAPANLDVSVRIASPGNDGPTTQTITAGAGADAQTQYQPPSDQYQSQQPVTPTTESAPPATESEPAVTQSPPAPSTIAAPSATTPAGWTWNWTWTCGDITGASTMQTIDTGISGWIWNWKLADTCVAPPISQMTSESVIPPKSSADISPAPMVLPGPAPPVLPVLPALPIPPVPPISPTPPEVVPPAAPVVALLPPALVEIVELAPSALEIDPSDRIAATGADAPLDLGSAGHHPVAPRDTLTSRVLPQAPFERSVSTPSTVDDAPAASRSSRERPVHRPTALRLPAPFAVAGAAAPASGGGSSAGSGVAAALALWFLLQFPGLAVLRLPRSLRSPRSRVDDPSTRPG